MEFVIAVGATSVALIIAFLWALQIFDQSREVRRHKLANQKLRELYDAQKYELVEAMVQRLNLRTRQLPAATNLIYSKVVDLYDDPELMTYPQRIAYAANARAGEYTYYWNVTDAAELDAVELFALWLEGIIPHGPT